MLVLARKRRESVVIGAADKQHEVLRVTVIDVRGGTVKLGFQADDNVPIYREEVWERVRSESRGPEPKPIPQPPKYGVPCME